MMEQLYADFNEKLLPQLQSGLAITQDYFVDLFGRYIQYLIITDSILLALGFLAAIILVGLSVILYKFEADDFTDKIFAGTILACCLLVCGGFIVEKLFDLTKALTVPEVRIYEELKLNGVL